MADGDFHVTEHAARRWAERANWKGRDQWTHQMYLAARDKVLSLIGKAQPAVLTDLARTHRIELGLFDNPRFYRYVDWVFVVDAKDNVMTVYTCHSRKFRPAPERKKGNRRPKTRPGGTPGRRW